MASADNVSSISGASTSATSDEEHDSVVLMANNTITVCINEQHKTYMKACCSDGVCFANFKDLETRILDADPQPLFSNTHMNDSGLYVSSCPITRKWSEFLLDLWNWRTHDLFEENYVTELDVNHFGNGKIYAAWRVMDQYRGRYRRQNLTHNVVDIMITLPEQNLTISEHFCYKYFRRATGSPYTLVPEILRKVVDQLYYKYYVDMSLATAQQRVHFTCAYCLHEEDKGPEKKHIKSIPKWYLKELYSTTKRVSKNLFLWSN